MASRALPAATLPIVVKALVGALLVTAGFVAVSDDDFARVVIAQRFAEAPSADPSGTSWLPVPFWIYGVALAAFGPSLDVARAVAFVLGLASIGAVFVAARWLGASERGARLGAIFAAILPHSAWLGVATVPALPTAALMLLGIAGACSASPKRALIGAVALGAATLSRYEAWPVAATFSLLVGLDALRTRSAPRAIASAVASGGIVLWILHGIFVHGDALFFLHRVSSYRDALARARDASALGPLRPLFALLVAEPELTVAAILGALRLRASRASSTLGWRRPAQMAGALVLFLCVGAALGGEATHHPQRPLVAIWLLGAIVAGIGLSSETAALGRTLRGARGAGLVAGALALIIASRLHFPRDSFAPRTDERAIGAAAREKLPPDARLLVDTPDYGYFAVMAAFGAPSRTVVLREHDPRAADDEARDLVAAARDAGATWLVTTRAAAPGGQVPRALAGDLVLLERAPPP